MGHVEETLDGLEPVPNTGMQVHKHRPLDREITTNDGGHDAPLFCIHNIQATAPFMG